MFLTFHLWQDMGVTLPALYWDFKSAYRCRDRIMSPVNSDGGTGAETFGELVFAQRPLAQERAVTASPEVCSSCLMVNPGPCSHHAAYCLDRRRCMLPRGDGIDAVVEVPLAVMGGHIYFFCLCSSCASHSQRAAHGGPRRAPFGTRSLVDLRQHMQEEFSTWLSEDVWKVSTPRGRVSSASLLRAISVRVTSCALPSSFTIWSSRTLDWCREREKDGSDEISSCLKVHPCIPVRNVNAVVGLRHVAQKHRFLEFALQLRCGVEAVSPDFTAPENGSTCLFLGKPYNRAVL